MTFTQNQVINNQWHSQQISAGRCAVLKCPVLVSLQFLKEVRARTGAVVNLFEEEKNASDRVLQVCGQQHQLASLQMVQNL